MSAPVQLRCYYSNYYKTRLKCITSKLDLNCIPYTVVPDHILNKLIIKLNYIASLFIILYIPTYFIHTYTPKYVEKLQRVYLLSKTFQNYCKYKIQHKAVATIKIRKELVY